MKFLFWEFGKKKKSRETAKKRLEQIVGTTKRRQMNITEIIPKEILDKNSDKIKERIASWLSETFNVEKEKIKIDLEEREGHVVIITNVFFK